VSPNAKGLFDIYDFYERMEDGRILLSFKGEITPDLLSSVLKIMESKLDNIQEEPRLRKKVYNVLVECLQNLYHHNELTAEKGQDNKNSAIFLIGRNDQKTYRIITGNYISSTNLNNVKSKIDHINSMSKEQLKEFYIDTLNNESFSEKGGGGLGLIDIARKSGHPIAYDAVEVQNDLSFISLVVTITNT
jgi:hypothetical protein